MVWPSLATFIVLLMGLNRWGWQAEVAGWALGGGYLVLTSWLMGGRLKLPAAERLVWGLMTTLAAVAIVGSALFYLNLFNPVAIRALLALLPWLGTWRPAAKYVNPTYEQPSTGPRGSWLLAGLYLTLAAATWVALASGHTTEAIRTPWVAVPPFALLLYAATALSALLMTQRTNSAWWLVPLYIVTLGLLPLVYPLGFGFDPIIHQTSEKLLALTGTISPKPLYYLGQYAIVVILQHVLPVAVPIVDTWLLPLLASLALPFSVSRLARGVGARRPWILLLATMPLLFTLTAFTYTTPQGLSYLWAWLGLSLMAMRLLKQDWPRWLPWLFAVTALTTHPLTGLPLLGLTAWWWLKYESTGGARPRLVRGLVAGATALVAPAAFVLLTWLKPSAASLALNQDIIGSLARLGQNILNHVPFLPHFTEIADAVYLWGRPLTVISLGLAAWGWYQAKDQLANLRFFGLAATLLVASYLGLTLLTRFPGLPLNEQDFYAVRLWELALICLWPLTLLGAWRAGIVAFERWRTPAPWLIGGALLMTASFYLTYPRLDLWHKDTAYNTTPVDVAAVQLIDNAADDVPYVVLANQAVAAAALREFGFAHYYAGHFYYPLPTGTNPLYGVYLNAAELGLPTKEVVAAAAQSAHVPQVYLVLNHYWARFDELTKVATSEADASWSLGQDRVLIYRYDF